MTSQELAALLIQQATPEPHYIQLSDQTLQQTGISALIKQNLLRPDGTLLLVVDPSTIPTNPPASGFSLSAQTPSLSSDTFLNLTARDVPSVNFICDGTDVEFTLTINLKQSNNRPVNWVLSDSYPELRGLPFDEVELPAAQMIFVTQTGGSPPQGLNFLSTFQLNNLFEQITELLSGGNAQLSDGRSFAELQQSGGGTYTLKGVLTQSAQGVNFTLEANLNVPSFNISTFFEMNELVAGISQQTITASDGTKSNLVMLYLGAYVTLKNSSGTKVKLALKAMLPINARASLMTLAIYPTDPFQTSLANLGQLVAGDSWSDFFSGQASSIGSLLNTFGFKSFITTYSLSTFSVSSFSLNVGTLQDWPLFPPLKSMSLDIDWMMLFIPGGNIQTLTISAVFNFTDEISFDVEVVLPDLLITGVQHGPPVTLTLSEIANKIFGGNVGIPDELLTFSFSDLNIGIDYPNRNYSFGATASFGFNLFGTQILSLDDMMLQVTVNTKGATTYTATLNGYISLGPVTFLTNATLSNTQDTVFELQLVDETLGSMLNHLIHLVDPTYDLSFDAPWDKLLAINLDAFLLKVNVTQKSVALSYSPSGDVIDLGFLKITSISLNYKKSETLASSVQIELTGSFLGQSFGTDGKEPLGWDAMNQQPPAVPGAGSSKFDLQYAGLGQHITFTDLDKLTTVEKVMTAMINSVIPTGGNALPSFGQNGLAFDKDSNWLIGAQFTVMGTVSLSIIFNDPNLYGLLISLAGAQAKSFAGLSFEILYRKVTETIGVYHIELKLPDVMRNLQFGAVSLTLPIIVLDIYTNGNFRIDFGFPQGMDFSRSFCLQILPFIGYGGFYFALLNGQTSTRVPQITNGNFNPVIEFGLGLSIGVGKTINAGVLSGGISVTVIGIVEGVIGWFNPNDASVGKAEYYWLQGTIAIVGKLYATIDFKIIKADLDVTAYASVTFIIEAHQPIYISLVAGVSVKVSIKIIFFTIHLSFSMEVKASFTIGSATPTPWQLAPKSSSANAQLRQLRGQDTLHHPQSRFAGLRAALRTERVVAVLYTDPPLNWAPVPVFPNQQKQTVDVYPLPSFTKTETVADGVNAILLLCLENSIAPDAVTHAEHRQLYGDDPQSVEFNLLLQGMLYWSIYARRTSLGEDVSTVTADDLAFLKHKLAEAETTEQAFNYANLTAFITQNFTFIMQQPTQNGDSAVGVTIFPIFPTVSAGGVHLQAANTDANYQEKIDVYFNLLQVQYKQGTASDNNGDGNNSAQAADAADDTSVSIATVVFEQYFSMLARAAVNAASDMLSQYQFTTTTASSIQDIINAVGDPMITPVQVVTPNQSVPAILNTGATIALNNILYQVKSGDSFANIAANFNAQGALSSEGQPLQASDIAAANLGSTGIFTLNTPVVFSTDDITNPNRITYTTQTGDTLNTIAARLLVRAAPASLLQQFVNLNQFMLAIINANQGVIPNPDGTLNPGTELNIPDPTDPAQTGIYTTVAGDTFTLVAAYFLGVQQQVVSYPGFVTEILALNTLQITDPTQPQNVGTILIIPPLTHNLQAADTINSLAITLITTPSIIQAWLLGATGSLLAPQSVLNMPALQYKIATADSLGSIAQKFNLSLTQLAKDLMEPLNPQDPTTVPKIFAASVNVIINDVETINVQTLMNVLLNQGEWNNIAGMVSRFLLNGLRLPDPTDPYFASLTVEQLENPTGVDFTRIVTQPMYALTGQQFAISTGPPPSNITIQNSDPVSWILSGSGDEFTEMQIDLSAYQQLISELADTPLDPQIQSLTRLELFQMAPPRFTLQQQMHWQAALLPSSPCFGRSAQATGGPSLWLFPDALITHLTSGADEDLKYELVVGTHQDATVPMVISDVSCYNWATIVNLTISLPQVDGSTPPAIANSYVMLGADENGRELLQELYVYLTQTNKSDKATLYLLYSPNPSSTNSSGLISDKLDPNQTYLLKTNLSTLSQSGPQSAPKAMAAPGDTDDLYDATLSDPANFIKLLWECSIVYSGGYYLNYVNADGNAGLPGELFAQGQTATLSLLIMLESQGLSALPPIYSFNNCVVVGDNIDASQSNIFVQPVVYVVPQGDSLTSVVSDYNANSGSSLTVVQFATFNENVTPLLLVGAALEIKGQSQSYTIGVGDTLAGIAKKFNTDVTTLVETGNNAQAPILTRGLRANLSDSGGPNPVTEPVPAGDSLTDAANFYNTNFGGNVTASDVAMLNADVPLLLLMGAQLQITGKPNYEIQYGDTLSSIAKEFQTDVATLVAMGHNVSAAILAPGAQAQFNQGVLQPSAAVPQGNVGFKLTRPNPDPYNLPWAQLSPQQIVASLFHLLRYSIATTAQTQDTPGFVASGLGLPTGPSNSSQAGTSGVTPGEQLDGVELEWYYQQTVAVAPFATSAQGSMSPALPPTSNSPFAGVAPKNSVTLNFSLQDIYGNAQEIQAPFDSLTIPVGYYTDITPLNRWPGMACSYEVLPGGNSPQIKLQLNMQVDKYLPSASVTVKSAQDAASGDLASYNQIYYQIQQPDLTFALETSLNSASISSDSPVYPINPRTPFTAFVNAAYIFLNALQSLKQFVYTCAGTETVGNFFTDFGVTAEQLFEANAGQAYSALFGQTPLSVPTMYPTIQDDTLSTVSALYGLTPLALATNNGDVPLNPGIALAAPNRPYKVHDGYNLQQIAIEWRCTITGIAEANHDIQNILKPGNIFTVEGVPQPVGNQDTFDSMVLKFANDPNKPLQLTVSELAEAVAETVSSIFIDEVTLQITEIVAQQSDAATRTPYTVPDNYSLKQIAQELNLSVIGIALASHNLLNILQPGIEISANNVSLPVGPDDTFDSMAQALESLSKLPVTVADVAVVNQALPGIFRDAAVLQVTQRGDSFNSLASDYAADGFTIEALVNQTNEALPNIFAPGTPLFITANPVPPQKNDTLSSYASNNKVTTDQLAQHNAQATFASGAQLDIPSLVLNKSTKEYPIYVADGTETLEKIAEIFPPLDAVSLVTLNRNVPGLVAPGVTITVQYDQQTFSVTAAPADTFNSLLAKFAAQGATLSLVDLALDLAPQPDLLAKDGVWLCAQQYSSYVARGTDTLNGIAGNYPNLTPTLLAILNQDIQGLFAPNQTIEDPQSQKSIVTAGTDSFNSLLGKFAAQGVTLLLADLVSDMAPQQNLLQPLAVWIAPPMVAANSFAVGTENTLAGLATKYNLDMGSLAQANASVQGFLASDVKLTYEGQSFETNANETFNSLIARIGQAGFTATVSDLAAAFENVNGLLNPTSLIVPLPAPTQTSLDLTTPKFSDAIFALTVDVVMRRDTDCVDPDFVTVTSVYEARTPIAPESTPSGNNSALSLVEFAANFESALPGLHVASGKAASENDSDMERQLWAVNFGSSLGPQINYKFGSGDKMQFFAVPPLSTSLMSDTAQIIPYASGVGLTGPAQTMNFQSIDLDVWANTFLQAVDLFLSPSYAVPAYALQTTPGVGQKLTPYENVVEQKGVLAQAISEQVEYILQQPGNIDADALPDARAALKQALLVQLSNAYSINSMVQVPVQVQSNYDSSHASLAPRLSGQPANSLKVAGATNTEPINITSPQHNLATGDMVIISGVLGNVAANGDWTVTVIDENTFSLNGSNGTTSQPYVQNSGTITVETARVNDFSLSTAKVPLVNGTDRATFLFTVKSPADNKQANLTLQYVINQLEVPTTEAATIDDYQASNWLTFILPLADQNSAIGQVTIPIPLRSYPSPVTLVGQTGEQSYPQPSTAEELYNWNYSFVYQHLDADQDTTCLKVQFNTGGGSLAKAINMPGLFDALAQFIAVYPQLKDDLALLPLIAPGTTNNTALVAIQTFSQLVENVAGAWGATPAALRRSAKGMAQPPYNYTLQREKSETAPSQLSKLIIIADENNVSELWPEVEVYLNDEFQPLIMELTPPGSKQAIYDYPAGVLAESSLQYRMTFQYLNVTNTQDGWAGVSITRNADLVQTAQTNTDFIYQTPLTYFSSVMIPFIYGSVDIDIKNSPTIGLAQALGQFFQTLLSCNPDLPAGTTRNIRVACNYGYQLAAPTTQGLSERRALPGLRADGNSNPLVSFMPVILIPSYPFDLSKSYNWQDPNSFVSRLADAVATWQDNNQPSTTNGAFFFDISLFSTLDPSSLQPLLEAPFVRYVLDESGKI